MRTQFDRLWTETFRYASEHSPFYRELFRGATSPPPLDEVPTVDKRTLSERNLDFLCVPRERIVEIVTTSGTTGQPLLWMLTESDLQRLALNEKQSFDCAGLTARDTVLVAVGMDRCFIAGLAYVLGLRELGCGVVRTGAASPLLVLEMIERVQPQAIVAVPSFLRAVLNKAREGGIDLSATSVTKGICIGEPIRDRSFALTAAGRAMASEWGLQLFSTYGVTELANSLCECQTGNGGHLHTDQLHLEVLDDEGHPVPDGEIGEIVATTFGVEAMPVIRYRTGDCAALFREPCACGRTSPRLGPVVGRKNQLLKLKGASVFPSMLSAAIEAVPGITAFVIVATADDELGDAVEVLYHGSAPAPALKEAVQARTKVLPFVRQVSREEIEALQLPPNTRKRRTFVDLR